MANSKRILQIRLKCNFSGFGGYFWKRFFEMVKADLEMQQADVYVGKTIYQAVIRKLLSSCCNCCFKKKPTEQPDPRLNWTIIDVEARFVILL